MFREPEKLKKVEREAESHEQLAPTDNSVSLGDDLKVDSVFVGKYKILSKLGHGGMSIVYQAKDITLDRTVAIKILRQQHSPDSKSLLRFQQEARAAGALSDSGIVGVHEFAVSDDGRMFLVMDFVEGKPLSEVIATQGNITVERSLNIALQAADALSYAHGQGVVHRDLKPSNIMLVADETDSQLVKIVDFGIAKITTLAEGQALTKTGEIFGSPLYMSPEQCSGARVDQRSDIYSLGCVLYEMLVGRPPHVGDTALSTAVRHLQDAPEELSSVRPDLSLPNDIETIVTRMLQKNASDRYQSMNELSKDLRLVMSGRRMPQKSVSVGERKKRINSLLYWLGILLLAFCSLLTGLSTFGGLSVGTFQLQALLQSFSLLVGFDLFVLSFVLAYKKTAKPSEPKSLSQKIEAEWESIWVAAPSVDVRTRRRLALLVIVQLFVFGLYMAWAQHPERSLFAPLPPEELHPHSR